MQINYRDLPLIMAAEPKKIERAAAKTINALAFDSLPEIVEHASRALDIQRNAKRALGFQVAKRARNSSPVALVATKRGWLFYHVGSGTRKPSGGLSHKGVRYLMFPVLDAAFTKRGRLRKAVARKSFVMARGRGGVLARRDRGKIEVLAVLGRQFSHRKALSPEDVISQMMRAKGGRLFRIFMARA